MIGRRCTSSSHERIGERYGDCPVREAQCWPIVNGRFARLGNLHIISISILRASADGISKMAAPCTSVFSWVRRCGNVLTPLLLDSCTDDKHISVDFELEIPHASIPWSFVAGISQLRVFVIWAAFTLGFKFNHWFQCIYTQCLMQWLHWAAQPTAAHRLQPARPRAGPERGGGRGDDRLGGRAAGCW